MPQATINGVVHTVSHNVRVLNGRVFIDDVEVTPADKTIHITVEGNLAALHVDACDSVHVTGSVGQLSSTAGDVQCGDVAGDVKSLSGDVTCGAVGGSASSLSGDVRCTTAGGGASSKSGSVRVG